MTVLTAPDIQPETIAPAADQAKKPSQIGENQSAFVRASIIITTRNRAEHLRQTLQSLASINLPADLPAEVIVVDNGSTDGTAQVVRESSIKTMPVRYLFEERPGQCHARNTGMSAARGDVIVFTDDDVRFAADWLENICRPILNGAADAVCGSIELAPHLSRDWMDSWHRVSFASTERADGKPPENLVGANMAFSKRVLKAVPGFDTELGPGALGFADDSLFSRQILTAGFTLIHEPRSAVVHHFDESRLSRKNLLEVARKHGRSWAYSAYHWEHQTIHHPRLKLWKARVRLAWWELRNLRRPKKAEGCASWEMRLRSDIHFHKQWIIESRRPRQYEQHGLIKRPSVSMQSVQSA
jgi:glycosyltransferase involved in cell wall biosynthesis